MEVEKPYKLLKDDKKKQLGNNNEAKMILYNALPLQRVSAVEEAKDLATLPFDELIGNLKVYEMVFENDDVAYKTTKEKVKSLALKAKVTREQTSDDSDNQGGSDEDEDEDEVEEFNLIVSKFCFGNKGGESSRQKRGCYNCEEGGHFIGEFLKPKENKAFVCLKCDLLPDDWILDSGFTKHMTGNRRFFTSYKAYDGEHVVFRSNLKGKVIGGGNTLHDSITIINVEHVSGLAFNLISVGKLCDDHCVVKFMIVDCAISKNGKTLAKCIGEMDYTHVNWEIT
ncbi:retrovirus-related pol polyprotein from transposon TNT 1-94 [Tanacetum coccineum]